MHQSEQYLVHMSYRVTYDHFRKTDGIYSLVNFNGEGRGTVNSGCD